MPFGDGTGPAGLGSMTGRAAGFCTGFGRPGFANPVREKRLGFGNRMSYGRFYAGRYSCFYPWRARGGWWKRWRPY